MNDVSRWMRRHRAWVSVSFDTLAWLVGFAVFAWLRLDTVTTAVPWVAVLVFAAATALVYDVIAYWTMLHRGRARTGSLEEMLVLGVHLMGVGGVATVVNLFGQWIPRSIPAGATLFTLVLAAWARASWRRLQELEKERRHGEDGDGEPVLIVGAGEAGRELLGSMVRDPERNWRPVGFLDDDPMKRHRRVRGIPVVGTTDTLAEQAAALGATTVVLALPSASADTIERLRVAAHDAELSVKVLPATTQLLTDHVGIRDLRDIDLSDVLGRNQFDTDLDAIAGYLTGRRVLVTGAGGSIGSELCRQIRRFAPAELMMLDRDESALHALQLSIHGRALLDSDEVILCDIRDAVTLAQVFSERKPEVVFHAAALKHLPMLEQYPGEAFKTNILGTRNVIDACDQVGVERFVNVSTDKAANPVSVLGYSKRITECLTAYRADVASGVYLSVRFGNVLGSRGSVLTSFAEQIAIGGPVTVTDPEVTRYFMTIEEACQLVIQAAAIGDAGEALVLDMGEPVSILGVAQRLIDQQEAHVDIQFTGLRDGEKLHEELFGETEPRGERRTHPLVSHVPVPAVTDEELEPLGAILDPVALRQAMKRLCIIDVTRQLERDYVSAR